MYQMTFLFSNLELVCTPTPGLSWLFVVPHRGGPCREQYYKDPWCCCNIFLKLFEIVIKPTYLCAEHS